MSCGATLPPGASFCPACGVAVAVEDAGEERKLVTVVFADVTGSTIPRRTARPGAVPRGDAGLRVGDARGDRSRGRHRREVHRRCRHGRVRGAGRARRRRRPRPPGRAPDAPSPRGPQRGTPPVPRRRVADPRRREHRGCAGGDGAQARRGDGDRRRRERRGPPPVGRRPGLRAGVRAHHPFRPWVRVRGSRRAGTQGQTRSGPCVPPAPGDRGRVARRPRPHRTDGRARWGARCAAQRLRTGVAGSPSAPRDPLRRRGRRQVTTHS